MFYVTMIDKFMSGWGLAEGKQAKFVVACDTYEQAETIERNAKRRSEMSYVYLRTTKPRAKSNQILTFRTYDQLGRVWKK